MRSLRVALLALGALLAALLTAPSAQAAPLFKAPFPCGQQWTYSHHSAEVRRALDFVRSDGGSTAGTPVLASAAGTATRHNEPGGAGQYIVIDHGGGWTTYYFHLASYSVPSGARVAQGEQIGVTGSTGNTTGPHLHYEQLLNGVGQNIVINGQALPYPGSYYQSYLTSDNCGGGDSGRYWVDTFADTEGYAGPSTASPQGLLYQGTSYVYCKVAGERYEGAYGWNHWWLRTDLDETYPGGNGRGAYVPAYYLSRWGNDEARDNNGTVIPDC
ncbi:M23 family metallopeptidase [Streptomyces hoynatensis]|uniref:M23 family metallopeptidase n=1 Tax=Streptomyces hoynatensis TaxID=1141874 RepID=A0A3A9Z0L0_9ACTN|nr:M23 family metallopeptidase [Streptomyces hoynatensis]RKN41735.1 M23 family metallopeptidase [Streptomyces hoynatensis]